MDQMFLPYARYFEFGGRSTRTEYWLFTLLLWSVLLVLFIIGGGMDFLLLDDPGAIVAGAGTSIAFLLLGIFMLFSFIPALAVTVRRFHDAGFSGWVYVGLVLVAMIPFIGLLANLAMLVIAVLPSVANNKWGDNPNDDWGPTSNYGYDAPEGFERPQGVRYR
ncbi:DUF805 domain-containing protein [Qipengyuania sphaerica]|uniref:DUF805 domain-containing protein n=1 Tax=Qipengyuania sphaerica TaxID=2867243 RepID=UPI001C8678B2|nr:DUF805 domain-containing protein [Qipengyuania sphaerica]MBX7540103.1 DUF805 domain-containing protein [Qipengyuania sphaerica]